MDFLMEAQTRMPKKKRSTDFCGYFSDWMMICVVLEGLNKVCSPEKTGLI